MATPAVSGVAALVRQFIVDGMHEIYSSTGHAASDYNSSHPSSALLKAVLIGSTVPLASEYNSTGHPITLADFYSASSPVSDTAPYALGTTGVDYHQGFGHVLLGNVLSLDSAFDTFLYESSLEAYGFYTLEFVVVANSTEVDITLVWTDPPGFLDTRIFLLPDHFFRHSSLTYFYACIFQIVICTSQDALCTTWIFV